MKIGTLIFTVILLLVGFGYLAATCWDQRQEIQDLRQEIEALKGQLQICRQQQATVQEQHDQDQALIAARNETIRQLEAKLQEQEQVIQALRAGQAAMQANMIEFDRQCRAEIDRQKMLVEQLSTPEGAARAATSQADTPENSLPWLAGLAELLAIEPQRLPAYGLAGFVLVFGCGVAMYGSYVVSRRTGRRG